MLILSRPALELFVENLKCVTLDAQLFFHMHTVLAASDVAEQAVKRTRAVWIYGIIIQEPGISPLSLVEDRFDKNFSWHYGSRCHDSCICLPNNLTVINNESVSSIAYLDFWTISFPDDVGNIFSYNRLL